MIEEEIDDAMKKSCNDTDLTVESDFTDDGPSTHDKVFISKKKYSKKWSRILI